MSAKLTKTQRRANNLPYRDKVPTAVREKFVRRFMNRHKVLVLYIRDNCNRPYGVVVGFRHPENHQIVMGHSIWNRSSPDVWNKYEGLDWAIQRALVGGHTSLRNNEVLAATYGRMKEKSDKYFKSAYTMKTYEEVMEALKEGYPPQYDNTVGFGLG